MMNLPPHRQYWMRPTPSDVGEADPSALYVRVVLIATEWETVESVTADQEDVYSVTTDDRRMFSCHVELAGREQQPRRIFVDTDHVRYARPRWRPGE